MYMSDNGDYYYKKLTDTSRQGRDVKLLEFNLMNPLGHSPVFNHLNSYSAGIDFRRHNLTSVLKFCKSKKVYNGGNASARR